MKRRIFNLNATAWRRIAERHMDARIPIGASFRYASVGRWFSLIERLIPVAMREPVLLPRAPIFIVGHWRSGTTFLHETMCAAPGVRFLDTHACMNPQTFLLGGRARDSAEMQRPMDAVVVRSSLPQEDEFALFGLGAPSAYEAFLIPQAVHKLTARAAPDGWSAEETEAWHATFRMLMGACAGSDPDALCIIKSPTHSLRIDLIRAVFPGARFVQVVRRPADVFASTRDMWHQMWTLYALTPEPSPIALAEAICRSILETDQAITDAFSRLESPPLTLRFEDMIADTQGAMAQVARALGEPRLAAAPKQDKKAPFQRASRALPPEEVAMVVAHCHTLAAKYGYEA